MTVSFRADGSRGQQSRGSGRYSKIAYQLSSTSLVPAQPRNPRTDGRCFAVWNTATRNVSLAWRRFGGVDGVVSQGEVARS